MNTHLFLMCLPASFRLWYKPISRRISSKPSYVSHCREMRIECYLPLLANLVDLFNVWANGVRGRITERLARQPSGRGNDASCSLLAMGSLVRERASWYTCACSNRTLYRNTFFPEVMVSTMQKTYIWFHIPGVQLGGQSVWWMEKRQGEGGRYIPAVVAQRTIVTNTVMVVKFKRSQWTQRDKISPILLFPYKALKRRTRSVFMIVV